MRHESPAGVPMAGSSVPPPPPVLEPHRPFFKSPKLSKLPSYQKYFDYVSFCSCEEPNQVPYFNPKTREFYYHQIPEPNLAGASGEGFVFFSRKPSSESSEEHSGQFHYPSGPRNTGAKYFGPSSMESGIAEASFVILAFILWLYSFYRLYSVWQNTLNFSEANIQGPQGWDFLVNWIFERVQLKRIKTIGKPRKCEPYDIEEGRGSSIEMDDITQMQLNNNTSIEIDGYHESPQDARSIYPPPVLNFYPNQRGEDEECFSLQEEVREKNNFSQSAV